MNFKTSLESNVSILGSILVLTGCAGVNNCQTPSNAQPVSATVITRCQESKKVSKRKRVRPLLCGPPSYNIGTAGSTAPSNVVEVQVLIDEQGKAISVAPISGNRAFYDQAIKAIKQMRLTPKIVSGRAVKSKSIIHIVIEPAAK
jgi:outer membrane biosynthesis protein TonB